MHVHIFYAKHFHTRPVFNANLHQVKITSHPTHMHTHRLHLRICLFFACSCLTLFGLGTFLFDPFWFSLSVLLACRCLLHLFDSVCLLFDVVCLFLTLSVFLMLCAHHPQLCLFLHACENMPNSVNLGWLAWLVDCCLQTRKSARLGCFGTPTWSLKLGRFEQVRMEGKSCWPTCKHKWWLITSDDYAWWIKQKRWIPACKVQVRRK